MLGRLHMSVDECISAYMDYSEAMHEPKQSKWNAFMITPFRSTRAERLMQDIIRKGALPIPISTIRCEIQIHLAKCECHLLISIPEDCHSGMLIHDVMVKIDSL